jgi:hypothetical protein
MTPEEKLNFLAGQVAAMNAFLSAVVATHPNAQQLLAEFDMRAQVALAATIPTSVSEAYLDGFRAQADSLRMR